MELSRVQKRIIKAASQSAGPRRISFEELADRAKCKEEQIHKYLAQSEEFRGLFLQAIKNSLVAEVPGLVKSFLRYAHEGSFKHGKVILEMAGAHTDKQEVSVRDKTIEEAPFKNKEDFVDFLEKTAQKVKNLAEEGNADA